MRSVFVERPRDMEFNRLAGWKRFLFIWAPAIVGIGVIVMESTATFSAANTSSWLRPVAERLFGPVSAPEWEHIHHLIRKTGHFIGYGTLCALFLRAWLLTLASHAVLGMQAWRMRSWMYALISTFLVASCDELHQSFLPSRTGLFSDVMIDTCGGLVLTGLLLGLTWRPGRQQPLP